MVEDDDDDDYDDEEANMHNTHTRSTVPEMA